VHRFELISLQITVGKFLRFFDLSGEEAMKRIYTFAAVITAVFAFAFTSVQARSVDAPAVKPVQSIEQQVNKKIHMLTNYGVFDHITFQVNGSVVTLNGKVNSLGTKSEAAATVKRIPGVEEVINNIQNLPPSSMDDAIRVQTLRTLARGGLGGYFWEANPDVRIIVQNGHITLEGYVMNSGDRNRANILANGVSGVFSVTNNLIVGEERKY
jgi:hyperosmotically inducible periplasmic protein